MADSGGRQVGPGSRRVLRAVRAVNAGKSAHGTEETDQMLSIRAWAAPGVK